MFPLFLSIFFVISLSVYSAPLEVPYVLSSSASDPWFENFLSGDSGSSSPCGDYSISSNLVSKDPSNVLILAQDKDQKFFQTWFLKSENWKKIVSGEGQIADYGFTKVDSLYVPSKAQFLVTALAVNKTGNTYQQFLSWPGRESKKHSDFSMSNYETTDDSEKINFSFQELQDADIHELFPDLIQYYNGTKTNEPDWDMDWNTAFGVPVVLSFEMTEEDRDFPFLCAHVLLVVVAAKYTCCGCCSAES